MKKALLLILATAIPTQALGGTPAPVSKPNLSKSAFMATQNEIKKKTSLAFKNGVMVPFALDNGTGNTNSQFTHDFIHGGDMDTSFQNFGIAPPASIGHSRVKMPHTERHFNGEEPIDTSDDMPNMLFESCMRFQLNSGSKTKQAMSVCQALNPGHDDSDEHKGDHSVVHANHDLEMEGTTYFHAGKKENEDKDNSVSETETARIVSETALAPQSFLTSQSNTDGNDLDCDVSKDLRVMLSPRCLKKADSLILNHVDKDEVSPQHQEGGLHIPSSSQQITTIGDGKHSLFATVPVYKGANKVLPGLTTDDINDTYSRPHTNGYKATSKPTLKQGPISCLWSYALVGVPSNMRSGTLRGVDTRTCIREALSKSSDIKDGVITSLTLENKITLRRDMVECHRHRGHDICKAL